MDRSVEWPQYSCWVSVGWVWMASITTHVCIREMSWTLSGFRMGSGQSVTGHVCRIRFEKKCSYLQCLQIRRTVLQGSNQTKCSWPEGPEYHAYSYDSVYLRTRSKQPPSSGPNTSKYVSLPLHTSSLYRRELIEISLRGFVFRASQSLLLSTLSHQKGHSEDNRYLPAEAVAGSRTTNTCVYSGPLCLY